MHVPMHEHTPTPREKAVNVRAYTQRLADGLCVRRQWQGTTSPILTKVHLPGLGDLQFVEAAARAA